MPVLKTAAQNEHFDIFSLFVERKFYLQSPREALSKELTELPILDKSPSSSSSSSSSS